jgi:hypothetical protein
MPALSGLALPATTSLAPYAFEVNPRRADQTLEVLRCTLQCAQNPLAISCAFGVLYFCPQEVAVSHQPRNQLATQIRNKAGKIPDGMGPLHGLCLLVGEDEKGNTVSLTNEARQEALKLYQEVTGLKLGTSKKTSRPGPKLHKRGNHFFAKDFNASRGQELKAQGLERKFGEVNKECREAWNNMTAEQKQPYMALEAADRKRYEEEKAIFDKKNPEAPKKARNAYTMFSSVTPKTDRAGWNDMTEEQKQPFQVLAEQDKVRYEQEITVFKAHCTETGKDFDALTAPKPSKTGAEPAAKKRKQAAVDPAAAPVAIDTSAPVVQKEKKPRKKKTAAAPAATEAAPADGAQAAPKKRKRAAAGAKATTKAMEE